MATVVALLPDRTAQATLSAAVRGRGRAVFGADPATFLDAVGRERPQVALVALRDAAGASTEATIRAVRDGFPSVAVVGYCHAVTAATPREVMLATQAGVGDLVVRGSNAEVADLQAVLDRAARGTLAARVARDLGDALPAGLVPLVRYCLANGHRPLAVEDVADAMAVHRKTLAYRLEHARLPAPSAVIGWCRLTVAAQLMEDPARSTEQIAADLEFASGAALRNMLMRYTGLRPRDVRSRGGVACLVEAFRRALAVPGGAEADPPAPPGPPAPGGVTPAEVPRPGTGDGARDGPIGDAAARAARDTIPLPEGQCGLRSSLRRHVGQVVAVAWTAVWAAGASVGWVVLDAASAA